MVIGCEPSGRRGYGRGRFEFPVEERHLLYPNRHDPPTNPRDVVPDGVEFVRRLSPLPGCLRPLPGPRVRAPRCHLWSDQGVTAAAGVASGGVRERRPSLVPWAADVRSQQARRTRSICLVVTPVTFLLAACSGCAHPAFAARAINGRGLHVPYLSTGL